ncbi:hypothetical protein R3P38DRAFT_1703746 [Favolaschia claudopus]|uniref:Uncharacterized protein n=1 Tax=Favolaschia claudopus TaxID=2862362 RepID=A0AAW0ABK7_9AGAR
MTRTPGSLISSVIVSHDAPSVPQLSSWSCTPVRSVLKSIALLFWPRQHDSTQTPPTPSDDVITFSVWSLLNRNCLPSWISPTMLGKAELQTLYPCSRPQQSEVLARRNSCPTVVTFFWSTSASLFPRALNCRGLIHIWGLVYAGPPETPLLAARHSPTNFPMHLISPSFLCTSETMNLGFTSAPLCAKRKRCQSWRLACGSSTRRRISAMSSRRQRLVLPFTDIRHQLKSTNARICGARV